jgi:hypothetical protein
MVERHGSTGPTGRPLELRRGDNALGRRAALRQLTQSGNQGRLRWPPQAARAAGPPRTRTGRRINRAKRTMRRGRSTPPRRAMHSQALPTQQQELAPLRQLVQGEGLPQGKHVRRAQAADLQVCAPGRTRTCTLRIRSRPTARLPDATLDHRRRSSWARSPTGPISVGPLTTTGLPKGLPALAHSRGRITWIGSEAVGNPAHEGCPLQVGRP